jgi:uncharacterized membrane protein
MGIWWGERPREPKSSPSRLAGSLAPPNVNRLRGRIQSTRNSSEQEHFMANYLIIGGDGKEYGPVTDADVRKWIAEGRLSALSQAKSESDAEFRPLAQFPEFAEAFAPSAVPGTIGPIKSSTDFLERDYELDLGGCISRGYHLVKDNFGTLILSYLLMEVIGFVVGYLIQVFVQKGVVGSGLADASNGGGAGYTYFFIAVTCLVTGPLIGGFFLIYLKTIRQQATDAGKIFEGFQKAYVQLFLGALVVFLIVGACKLPFDFFWQAKVGPVDLSLEHIKQALDNNDTMALQKLLAQFVSAVIHVLPVMIICMIPVTYLTVCWQFTLPLIIDKQMNFGAAMKASGKMVNKHWWQVFGLIILISLLNVAGLCAFGVGLLFTIPVGYAALMYAYETIFGAEKN